MREYQKLYIFHVLEILLCGSLGLLCDSLCNNYLVITQSYSEKARSYTKAF